MAVPEDAPHTVPDVATTVAIDVAPLLHTPPDVASASGVLAPAHTLIGPVTIAGDAVTDIIFVTVHPEPSE